MFLLIEHFTVLCLLISSSNGFSLRSGPPCPDQVCLGSKICCYNPYMGKQCAESKQVCLSFNGRVVEDSIRCGQNMCTSKDKCCEVRDGVGSLVGRICAKNKVECESINGHVVESESDPAPIPDIKCMGTMGEEYCSPPIICCHSNSARMRSCTPIDTCAAWHGEAVVGEVAASNPTSMFPPLNNEGAGKSLFLPFHLFLSLFPFHY